MSAEYVAGDSSTERRCEVGQLQYKLSVHVTTDDYNASHPSISLTRGAFNGQISETDHNASEMIAILRKGFTSILFSITTIHLSISANLLLLFISPNANYDSFSNLLAT